MRVDSCILRRIELPLREPMRTAYGMVDAKSAIIVEVRTSTGAVGVAECVAMAEPGYTEETVETAWVVIVRHILPLLNQIQRSKSELDPKGLIRELDRIRGNRMAKAGVEMAVWDAWAAETRRPLHELIGGSERDVEVGISLGMYADPGALRERVEAAKEQGYRRIKLKIAPGQDLVPIRTIREMFPELPLMADANSAYQMAQIERIRQMDEWRLMMIEQPLAYDDLVDHAALQSIIDTPICLDESIRSAEDVRRVADIGACRIVNVKPGRLGGFSETIQLHETAVSNGIGLWCGGMYETGVGRLHNLAVCSLPGFLLPTDNGPSDRYFARDILTEPVRFSRPGYLTVEPMCGVATKVDWEMLDFITADRHVYRFDTSNRA